MTQLTHQDCTTLVRILATVDFPCADELLAEVPRLESLLAKIGNELRSAEEAHAAEEARRKRAIPQEVPNWVSVEVGTLVKRSKHYLKDRYCSRTDKATQVGMVTELKYFKDDLCTMVVYPVIHWQGESFGSINHPMNACLADGTELPTITMNANQQED